MDESLLATMVASTLRLATPLIFCALAGLFSERSGVVDIGLEGKMLFAAFAAGAAGAVWGSTPLALLAAIGVAVALSWMHGLACVSHRGDQVVSGVAINIIAAGLTVVLAIAWFAQGGQTPAVSSAVRIQAMFPQAAAALAGIPWLGPIVGQGLLSHNPMVYLALALVPAVIAFERRFPLQWESWRANWRWHVMASVVFSVVHVLAMVGLRKLAYASQGEAYGFGNWPLELFYEYLKDARSYGSILILVALYRLLLLRLQGEASLLDAPDDGPAVEPVERPERFLVRKLGKEYLLPAAEVEWLQAWGNYVNLRVRAHDYPLRATMASIEARLDPARFVRVHRSYIVNLDYVQEIEPLDSGDARARMRDGGQVPVSRRYRDSLRKVAQTGSS